jgi:hypothetical protein
MKSLLLVATTLLLTGSLALACGSRTSLDVPRQTAAVSCNPADIPVQAEVPNLYFVLDRSSSMKEQGKWTTMRVVISDLMSTMGQHARFGATEFPAPGKHSCSAGVEVMAPRMGDGLPATVPTSTAGAFLDATSAEPHGSTPTAATFLALTPMLAKLGGGPTFAILATDGGPNCEPHALCTVDQCISNIDQTPPACMPSTLPNCCAPHTLPGPSDCLDTTNTVAAVAALAEVGVPTFVIGMPGSAPYVSVLDDLAEAGRTARGTSPQYYPVDTADTEALEAVLLDIATRTTVRCLVDLARQPADASKLRVSVDGAPVPQDPMDGWTLEGSAIRLHGSSCDPIVTGGNGGVKVAEGCP